MVKPDFVGWSGLIPISMFIENIIGINADASENTVVWRSTGNGRHGIERLRFGDIVTTLVRESKRIDVESNAGYRLVLNGKEYDIVKGKYSFEIE